MIHAERLFKNQVRITPPALAASLQIHLSTLYDRYKKEAIQRACRFGQVQWPGSEDGPKDAKKTPTVHKKKDAPVWLAKHPKQG
jgi:hypothetical protein